MSSTKVRRKVAYPVRLAIASIAVFLGASAAAQTLYISKDPSGSTVITNVPPPGQPPADSRHTTQPQAAPGPLVPPTAQPRAPVVANTNVVLYAADWCPHCRRARAYLQANGIAYTDVNVDTPAGRQAFAAASQERGIPFLVAGGRQLRGFSERSYDAVFKARR